MLSSIFLSPTLPALSVALHTYSPFGMAILQKITEPVVPCYELGIIVVVLVWLLNILHINRLELLGVIMSGVRPHVQLLLQLLDLPFELLDHCMHSFIVSNC